MNTAHVPRTVRPVLVGGALLAALSGCASHAPQTQAKPRPETGKQASQSSGADDHRGSLSTHERSLATRIARAEQHKVIGTFVGATAFRTVGTPFDPGSACDLHRRNLTIRLVWRSNANFIHSFPPGAPPDGPRKALLIVVDPAKGKICEVGAAYRNVGARAAESLLYGRWPDRKDS